MNRILLMLSCTALLGLGLLAYGASAQEDSKSPLGMAPTPYESVSRENMSASQRVHSKLFNHAPSYTDGKSVLEFAESREQGIAISPRRPVRIMSISAFFKDLKRQSDLIVVGTILRKTSLLTDNQQWIFTDYTLHVDQVFLNRSDQSVVEGSNVVVTRPGGNVLVNGHEVFMIDDSYRPLPPGSERYLLFLRVIPESGGLQSVGPQASFVLRPNGVELLSCVPLPTGFADEGEVVLSSDKAFLKSLRQAIRK